jgi:prepilin-type N-terminal cleavage/methylation domain-containing protein
VFRRGDKGFSLIEMAVAIAIIGIIVPGISMSIVHIFKNHEKASDAYIVMQQVQNTGHWISRDIQAADNVTLGNPDGFPVTLIVPVDTEESNNLKIVYSFESDRLKRRVYDSLDNLISESLVAQYIDTGQTSISSGGSNTYELTARAFRNETSVQRSYTIRRRLGSI